MELRCVMERRAKLLSALRRELRISDGLVRRLKPLDAFRVNGERAHTNRLLVPGDVVTVTIAEAAPDFPAEEGPLDILYEDDCLIAVDKPAGLIVHPTFARQTGTLANFLLGHYRRTGQACGVHVLTRLDRDTLGVVIFAKNAWAHWLLMEELDAGRVEKVYEALTLGGPAADEGEIDLPIAKRPNPSLLRYVDPSGKPARTRYRVLERGLPCPLRRPDCPAVSSLDETDRLPDCPPADGPACPPICRLELRPLTGRTHQLRVHCSYLGFPILGDPQYGTSCRDGTLPSAPPQAEDQATGDGGCGSFDSGCASAQDDTPVGAVIDRPREGSEIRDQGSGNVGTSIACPPSPAPTGQQLVAKRISLNHPLTGKRLTFVSRLELAGEK